MRRPVRAAWIVAVALSLSVWAPIAHADDEAVSRFERGVQLYEAENYEGALVEFNSAYRLSKNYKLLYNIGICQATMKDYASATESFKKYLAEGGSEVSEARRSDVRDRIAKLSLMIAKVRVTTDAPAGSTLLIDDQPAGTIPLSEPVAVKIGRRVFSISSQGKTATKIVDVSSSDQNASVSLSLDALPTTTKPEVPPPAPGTDEPSFPWLFWGLTAVLGGATVVTGALAVDARNDFEKDQATYGISRKSLDDDRSTARTYGLVTDVLLVGTVLSAGVSTYLTIRYVGKKKTTAGLTILPMGIGYARSF